MNLIVCVCACAQGVGGGSHMDQGQENCFNIQRGSFPVSAERMV